ncbi:PAS domain-containing protein [Methylorubrum sp. GM97]|uniref:PAS domain-containing protein n=1 Tax=Methylorubrum sp. GM97 TaxID=2938232 RepID=UPI0021C4BADB|nr:PAS domain-containing protein [Methylorubrum sp. GM97]
MDITTLDHPGLFEASPNAYLVLDRRLHIVGANMAYLASVKRDLSDIVGRWAWDAFPTDPETLRLAIASFETVIRTKRPDTMALLRFDVPRPASEGGGMEKRYWSITHVPVLGADGEVHQVLQHPIDVTELERLREVVQRVGDATVPALIPAQTGIFERARSVYADNLVLRAERERQQHMLQQMPGFVCLLTGPDHVYEYVNDAYLAISGPRTFLGRTVREVFPELAGQGFYELLDQVYATGAPYAARSLPIRLAGEGEGRFIDLLYHPVRDHAGAVSGIFVGGYDVSEQVRSQRALAESEERYRTLFETIDVGFCIVEMKFKEGRAVDYRIAEANPAFERQTGAKVAGLWVSEFAPNLERHWFDTYGRVALTGEPAHFENHAEVFGRWFDVRALRVGDPAAHRVAIFFSDITERKSMEEAMRRLNTSLESRVEERTAELMRAEEALRQSQKMEAVGQLTGGLAHDFNNLLAGISGSLELMQTRMQQGRVNDVERYMAAAQGAAKRAAALTHRLLAFSRRQTLDPKPTDVNRLVSGMHDLIQRTIGPAVAFEFIGVSGAWPTLVDPHQLENALLNLCINARDAMPEGGGITIETANKWLDEHAARRHDMPEGQHLCLSVTDTGSGMAPEVVSRVFEPFFTTKPIGQGTGLGLSMIYGFVQQSGGQVRIYSEVGMGTTVCIYLPRHYGDLVEEDGAELPIRLPRLEQDETVLVVDDEPTVRMLVTDILDDLGYTAIEAGDSAAGLRILQSDVRIDLLVTDVGLPGGMNGRQMADAGRVHRPDLKVLFITGYAENAAVGNGHLAPGMAVLTKPFPVETMAARIRSLIEARQVTAT